VGRSRCDIRQAGVYSFAGATVLLLIIVVIHIYRVHARHPHLGLTTQKLFLFLSVFFLASEFCRSVSPRMPGLIVRRRARPQSSLALSCLWVSIRKQSLGCDTRCVWVGVVLSVPVWLLSPSVSAFRPVSLRLCVSVCDSHSSERRAYLWRRKSCQISLAWCSSLA
jgi:hypothetical protein